MAKIDFETVKHTIMDKKQFQDGTVVYDFDIYFDNKAKRTYLNDSKKKFDTLSQFVVNTINDMFNKWWEQHSEYNNQYYRFGFNEEGVYPLDDSEMEESISETITDIEYQAEGDEVKYSKEIAFIKAHKKEIKKMFHDALKDVVENSLDGYLWD